MDPDANWKEQQEIRAKMQAGTTTSMDTNRLVDLDEALTRWIQGGGYSPLGYSKKGSE